MSVLTVDNITVGYGKRLILENQSIVFDKPEIISIIGPNGSGKSTFLKALAAAYQDKTRDYIVRWKIFTFVEYKGISASYSFVTANYDRP